MKLRRGQQVCLEGTTNPPKRQTGRMDLAFSTVQTVVEVEGDRAVLTNGWKVERFGYPSKPYWQSVTHPGLRITH